MTYTFSYFDSKNFEIFYILLHLGWPDLAAGWRGWGRQEEKATDHVGAGTADAGADRLERQAGQAGALPPGQTEPGRQSMEVDRAGRQQPDCPCAAMIRLSNFPPNNPPFCCQWVQTNAAVTWLPKKIAQNPHFCCCWGCQGGQILRSNSLLTRSLISVSKIDNLLTN